MSKKYTIMKYKIQDDAPANTRFLLFAPHLKSFASTQI